MWLTDKSRIEQTDKNSYWKLADNELYMDESGKITITPRYFWTDGYTFPCFIMPFIGDKNKYDVRPAHAHDLRCRFHEEIVVKLGLNELTEKGYLHEHKGKMVCEDIPKKYLSIQKQTKKQTDHLLRLMMLDCNINKRTVNIIRFGVLFNLNFYFRTGKRSLSTYNIFNEDIGLVQGL